MVKGGLRMGEAEGGESEWRPWDEGERVNRGLGGEVGRVSGGLGMRGSCGGRG